MSFRKKVDQLTVWSQDGERAPHKPLLLLLVFARRSQRLPDEVSFTEIEETLTDLLVEFGPLRHSYHPEYPFWRLQQDGIWEVISDIPLTTPPHANALVTELRQNNARGRLPEWASDELSANPGLLIEVAQSTLDRHFPDSLHEDIAAAVGLALKADVRHRRRDPRFRGKVLMAYEYSCAICGLDLRLGNVTIGLEAAHIKWRQVEGPDIEENGLALCATHHKLFDFGALSLTDSGIIISQDN